jgi:hypothetical protein
MSEIQYALADVVAERVRQESLWGDQRHPDGTGRPGDRDAADRLRAACKANSPEQDNWRDILAEEVAEAFAETDPVLLRAELVQVAAVVVNWIQTIDRRHTYNGADRLHGICRCGEGRDHVSHHPVTGLG